VVSNDIYSTVTKIRRRIVGIEIEVFFNIVIGIGMVKRFDRCVEVSVLLTMALSHCRNGIDRTKK